MSAKSARAAVDTDPGTPDRARSRTGDGPNQEHALLWNRRRDSTVALIVTVVTIVIFVLMALRHRIPAIQRFDDRWQTLMLDSRVGPLTAIANVFNVIGLVYITLPVRLAVAGYLAWKRRWWHFAAFVSAMVVSELLIGPVKSLYDRPRPPLADALVHTTGASMPSGHAVAASVTTVAIVIALFPDGPRRFWWGVAAAAFSFVMALSRVYLGAHWMTDAIAGTLLGVSVAVDCALVVQEIWDVRVRRRTSRPPAPRAAPEAAGTPGRGG